MNVLIIPLVLTICKLIFLGNFPNFYGKTSNTLKSLPIPMLGVPWACFRCEQKLSFNCLFRALETSSNRCSAF